MPKDFWRASLPEIVGAIIGHNNRQIEEMKLTWEPARFVAFITANMWGAKLKSEQSLRRFPWEKRLIGEGETERVIQSVMKFRDVVKNKWGLKYLNE